MALRAGLQHVPLVHVHVTTPALVRPHVRLVEVEVQVALGARGVQVGTAFALCEESGLDPCDLRLAKGDAAVRALFEDRLAQ